jgi:hypothetical protein
MFEPAHRAVALFLLTNAIFFMANIEKQNKSDGTIYRWLIHPKRL